MPSPAPLARRARLGKAKLTRCGQSAGAGSEQYAGVSRKVVSYGSQAVCDNSLPGIAFVEAVQEEHGVTGCGCVLKNPAEWLSLPLWRSRRSRLYEQRQSDVRTAPGMILGDFGKMDKHWYRCFRVGGPAGSKLLQGSCLTSPGRPVRSIRGHRRAVLSN